jgi:hypothetical protein
MLNCDTTRSGCGAVRGDHSASWPHGIPSKCQGYVVPNPCDRCGSDLELHEIAAPHVREIGGAVTCIGAIVPPGKAESPYEGGGGQSGGGGSSGNW